jgi:hypothetical protein
MSITWAPWTNAAEGTSLPGSSVTAVPIPTAPGEFALFIADPGGNIYTASGNAQLGWGEWSWVAQGQAAPGAPVAAVPIATAPGQFALFIASPAGEVMTTSGNAGTGWALWSPVAEGSTSPGQRITAVPIATAPGQFAVFIADPGGYIYTASGNAQLGWGDWSWVAQGQAAPGSPVSAVPIASAPGEFALFIASPAGEVLTTSGNAQNGWAPWSSVAQGSTLPGSMVTAVQAPAAGQYAVFLADPGGAIYSASGNAQMGWGIWNWISQGRAAPGSPVTAVYLPQYQGGQIALFIADPGGAIYMSVGYWGLWTWVAEGRAAPKSLVTAVAVQPGTLALFITNPAGEVLTTSSNVVPPRAPSGLHLVNMSAPPGQVAVKVSVSIGWSDNSDDEDGFTIFYRGQMTGKPDDAGQVVCLPNSTTYTLALISEYGYTIYVESFNAAGPSAASNSLHLPIPFLPLAEISAGFQLGPPLWPYATAEIWYLAVTGSYFQGNEEVVLNITWWAGGLLQPVITLTTTANYLGEISLTYAGVDGVGFGAEGGNNTFQILAEGSLSGKEASTTA